MQSQFDVQNTALDVQNATGRTDEYTADHFVLGELLGEGGFGRVHRARVVATEQEVAVKIMTKTSDDLAIASEIEMLRTCRSEHVVSYHGALRDAASGNLWIVMECAEASLLDVMGANERCLTERQCAAVVAAALDGLLFLHRRQILHRDIKAANLLVTANGAVKLGDFGVATRLSSSLSARHTLVGTAAWLAPEVAVGTSALLARHVGISAGVGYGTCEGRFGTCTTAVLCAANPLTHTYA